MEIFFNADCCRLHGQKNLVRDKERKKEIVIEIQTYSRTERQKDRKTERQKDRKTERQKYRRTERQKDRKTLKYLVIYEV